MKNGDYLRILLPCPTWYIPHEKAPNVVRKMAMALGPVLGIRRANRTGAKPPGGGPSWRTGMSFTLAIPGFFLIIASVIFTFLDYSLSGSSSSVSLSETMFDYALDSRFQSLICVNFVLCEELNAVQLCLGSVHLP